MTIQANVLNPGNTSGPTLVLTEPLSFWGAFDPQSGTIVDVHHPQRGTKLTGKILLLTETRGSGGTPGGIAEAIRLGTGPLAIILIAPDINLAIGAAVAMTLYGKACPVLAVSAEHYATLVTCPTLTIDQQGMVTWP